MSAAGQRTAGGDDHSPVPQGGADDLNSERQILTGHSGRHDDRGQSEACLGLLRSTTCGPTAGA